MSRLVNIKRKAKNVFGDKASLILRSMLREPDKKWVVRDFVNAGVVSLGMASEVIDGMERLGYVEREKKGALSYTLLTNRDQLIQDWTRNYNFDLNSLELFYNPGLRLEEVRDFFKKRNMEEKYAFTLHSGANLLTSYVKTGDIFLYIDVEVYNEIVLDLMQQLDLKQLMRGGNVVLVKPYYKNSVFWGKQDVEGFNVVSNLQLYLDLYHFLPRGAEHAENLKSQLEQEGLWLN